MMRDVRTAPGRAALRAGPRLHVQRVAQAEVRAHAERRHRLRAAAPRRCRGARGMAAAMPIRLQMQASTRAVCGVCTRWPLPSAN